MHAACNFMCDVYSCLISLARTANLLGAIALGLADDILETAERHVSHGADAYRSQRSLSSCRGVARLNKFSLQLFSAVFQ